MIPNLFLSSVTKNPEEKRMQQKLVIKKIKEGKIKTKKNPNHGEQKQEQFPFCVFFSHRKIYPVSSIIFFLIMSLIFLPTKKCIKFIFRISLKKKKSTYKRVKYWNKCRTHLCRRRKGGAHIWTSCFLSILG